LDNVPEALFRGEDVYQKNVFLGQVCGYPLTHEFSGRFEVIATPVYRTPYFTGPEYRSVIVVHLDCEWGKLADAEGSRAVINSKNSHSGYNILRSMVTPMTTERPFFHEVLVSDGHRKSLAHIANKVADVAAIDALTWSLLERYAPEDLENVRILEISPPAPAPAFVTDIGSSDEKLDLFRKALQIACEEPELKKVSEQLFLESVEILQEDAYECILEMEIESIEDL
jgi:ABC-type phosphate/phosphonate transport system substrate-binding protein